MLQATPQLQEDLDTRIATAPAALPVGPKEIAPGHGLGAQKLKNAVPAPPRKFAQPRVTENQRQHTRIPAILGEAARSISVDGMISGQPEPVAGKRPSASTTDRSLVRRLNGELTFVDMIRVNGHIAGSVHSQKGTLIVDTSARVDASVDVAIAVIAGTVTGDIVAHERVELAPSAKIYGNIFTRSLAIQSGAIFEGVCQMLEDKPNAYKNSLGPCTEIQLTPNRSNGELTCWFRQLLTNLQLVRNRKVHSWTRRLISKPGLMNLSQAQCLKLVQSLRTLLLSATQLRVVRLSLPACCTWKDSSAVTFVPTEGRSSPVRES